ncbi:hypothetical protein NPIL_662371 [Nephila pilipes]|uniref:Uncharacterized protein n=1 Tax=Nephila pilipes TaxID=299642 RepID=A0A8X6N777_NEPPI|nr:hypothetical protein NPIL_662371 [Nephila pilipes]
MLIVKGQYGEQNEATYSFQPEDKTKLSFKIKCQVHFIIHKKLMCQRYEENVSISYITNGFGDKLIEQQAKSYFSSKNIPSPKMR